MKEAWKDVPGYEGIYEASTMGRVRSLKYDSHYRGRILKGTTGKNGYKIIALWKDGRSKSETIHRVVAKTFLVNPLNKRTVNHKNGNKTDNRVQNLEWSTDSENNQHAFDFLGRKGIGLKGNKNGHSRKIVQLTMRGIEVRTFDCIRDAEVETNIKHENISKVARGKRSHAGGFKWEYVDNEN
jgi:hypothetical protein